MQSPALLQTSDDITNSRTHSQKQIIYHDAAPSLLMHENVTTSNSPNNQHIFKHDENFNQNNNNNNYNYNNNNRVTNYYNISNTPSFLLSDYSSSLPIHSHCKADFIPKTISCSFNVLPPILTKELILNQHQENNDFDFIRTKVTDITRNMQQFHVSELEEEEDDSIDRLDVRSSSSNNNNNNGQLSPLSILCPTTNSLIQHRYSDNEEVEEEEEDNEDTLIWRHQFLDLMSKIINYSETLESISTELLKTEGQVRELVLLQKSIMEELEEKEKMYKDKLDECEQVSQQQIGFISSLIELDQDLDINNNNATTQAYNNNNNNKRRSTITNNTTTTYSWQSSEHSQQRGIFNKSCSSSSFTTVDSHYYRQPEEQEQQQIKPIHIMEDIVHKLRWEIGLRIGGSVSTGHVVHSFEGPFQGLELIIAGSGTIVTAPQPQQEAEEEEVVIEQSYIQSSSIQHIRFHRHHYMLHINHQDRKTRFKLLPRYLWTPDEQVNQCQFKSLDIPCSTRFNFFQRRHHCRRCGIIICQRHSLNRLPLFLSPNSNEKWCRVCDTCFHDLIIVTKKINNK